MSSSRNDFPIVHVKNYPFGTSNLELFEFLANMEIFIKFVQIHHNQVLVLLSIKI